MHHVRGIVTRQAHVGVPDGTVEEEFGRGGFFGRASHLYRKHPPVAWTDIDGDCRPELLAVTKLGPLAEGDFLASRTPFLRNEDVTLAMAQVDRPMGQTFRNADGDDVLFVHAGEGALGCDFGGLRYERGDYLVIPRGTAYRLAPTAPTTLLVIESRGEVRIPDRGLMGRHALFDPDVIEVPDPAALAPLPGDRHELVVKRAGRLTRVGYPFDPLDVVGWKGDLTVWRLNVRDIRPVMSERYHLPPTAHATFVADDVVICTFLPRALETGDPAALRVPFYHANIDYDEVLFYHDGEFFSRHGIGAGALTFHPQGIHHGPAPGAVEAAKTKTRTNEQAVMIDTRRPLSLTEAGRAVTDPDYWASWGARSHAAKGGKP